MRVMACLILAVFAAQVAMYLTAPKFNELGDGLLPAQSITATVLGYKRSFPCERGPWLPEDYQTCDMRSPQVQAWAPWAIGPTRQAAVRFGRLVDLGIVGTLGLIVFVFMGRQPLVESKKASA